MKHPLLKDTYPELFTQLHPTKNSNIDVHKLTCGSDFRVWWKCDKNHEWQTRVRNRAIKHGKCIQCNKKRIRTSDEEAAATEHLERQEKKYGTQIDNETEKYVMTLLQNMSINAERIGYTGSKSDIVITHSDGSKNHIQVKTLIVANRYGGYYANLHRPYPDDMLLVMVNKERTRFALDFFINHKHSQKISLSWNRHCQHEKIMCLNENEFAHEIIKKSRLSTPFTSEMDLLSPNCQKEQKMRSRFAVAANERGLIFNNNDTNGNSVDGFIEDSKLQLKFSSFESGRNVFHVNGHKTCSINGKPIVVPYDISDPFDNMVIEFGTPEGESRYEDYFCIIPKHVLVERHLVSSGSVQGCFTYSISKPFAHATRDHWSLKYWNNWDVFKHQ